MKKSLLLLLFAIATGAFAQNHTPLKPVPHFSLNTVLSGILPESMVAGIRDMNELVPVNDSIVNWQWDIDTDDWMLTSRTTDILYDENYNMISATVQAWSGTGWENQLLSTISYPDNATIIFVMQMWDGSDWVNFMQFITEMDQSTNTTTFTTQMWDGTEWVNQSRSINVYDDNENLLNEITQTWAVTEWMNVWQYTYAYDANGNLLSSLQQQWQANAWVNYSLNTLTYTPENNLSGSTIRMWQDNLWMNLTLDTLFTYDANNNNTGFVSMMWMEEWQNSTRTTNTYNANNDRTSYILESWSGTDWTMTTHVAYAYSYDVNGFIEGESQKDIDVISGGVTSGDSTHYYFHTVEISAGNIALSGAISVYPNPTQGMLFIDATGITGTIKSAGLFDLTGGLVRTLSQSALTTSQRINLSDMPKGVYLLKVDTGTGRYLGKVIVY